MDTTSVDVEIDCRTIDKDSLDAMGRSFDVKQAPGEPSSEFCENVKKEIERRLKANPKQKNN
jgi:hypothetical protein